MVAPRHPTHTNRAQITHTAIVLTLLTTTEAYRILAMTRSSVRQIGPRLSLSPGDVMILSKSKKRSITRRFKLKQARALFARQTRNDHKSQ